jgi:hypothetical protein
MRQLQCAAIVGVVGGLVAVSTGVAQAPASPPPEETGGVGLSAKLGTLGIGADVTLGLNEYVGFRLVVNTMALEPESSPSEGDVYADLEYLTYGALLDVHPFGGGFRVSGGALINDNKFKLRADTDEPVNLDDQYYQLEDFAGEMTFADLSPYLGFGYGQAVGGDGHWHFACDFGVLFQGEPDVTATAQASNPAAQGLVDQALEQEIANIEDDFEWLKFYPVIAVGVSYRF